MLDIMLLDNSFTCKVVSMEYITIEKVRYILFNIYWETLYTYSAGCIYKLERSKNVSTK